eukprot:5865428-Prymnesium_polylepis.1
MDDTRGMCLCFGCVGSQRVLYIAQPVLSPRAQRHVLLRADGRLVCDHPSRQRRTDRATMWASGVYLCTVLAVLSCYCARDSSAGAEVRRIGRDGVHRSRDGCRVSAEAAMGVRCSVPDGGTRALRCPRAGSEQGRWLTGERSTLCLCASVGDGGLDAVRIIMSLAS